MKRLSWILSIGLLLLLGYYFYSQNKGEAIREDLVLHVEDTAEIAQIIILNRAGKKQSFSRRKQYWVNDKGEVLRADAINNLLTTIHSQRVSSLIPKAAMDNVVKDLSSNSVLVQLMDKKGDKLLSFYVGGVTPDDRGTFMIREQSEIPVIVNIPGFEGNLRTRYIMSENDWASRELLPELNSVKQIRLDFPRQQEESFIFRYNEDNIGYVQKRWDTEMRYSEINTDKLKVYVDRLKNLYAEALLDPEKIEDLEDAVPFCVLEVVDEEDQIYSLSFFPQIWIDMPNEAADMPTVERYYTYRNDGKLFLTQHLLMQKIFIGYEHFVSSLGSESKM